MKELKFRVWDKKDKKWIYKIVVDNNGNLWQVIGNGKKPYTIKILHPKDFELVFYTGLKDKEGNEIYEDDIVKVKSTQLNDTQKVVKWDDTGFNIKKEDWQYIPDSMGGQLRGYENVYTYEVIGNIYQNKNLLKGGE